MSRKRLGRGIEAIFGQSLVGGSLNELSDSRQSVIDLNLNEIEPEKKQPRKNFDERYIQELADSIQEKGLIQPIVVTKSSTGRYRLVAGERRYRAFKKLKKPSIPAIISTYFDKSKTSSTQRLELALVENIQRQDLSDLEKASAYQAILKETDLSQEQLAKRLGQKRATVANLLRLLSLSSEILTYLKQDKISTGHAKLLLSLEEENERLKLCHDIFKQGLSVRQTEDLVKKKRLKDSLSSAREETTRFFDKKIQFNPEETDPLFEEIVYRVFSNLGLGVRVTSIKNKGKKVQITLKDARDSQNFLDILRKMSCVQ